MKKNLRIIFSLTLCYSVFLLIAYLNILIISDFPQALLKTLVPSINENKICYIIPAAIILVFHFIIFQKDIRTVKTAKHFKIICLLILYLNIFVTIAWVSSVENQIVSAYKIANSLNKYYDTNIKYPPSIDSILSSHSLQSYKKDYYYCKENPGGFWLTFSPKEIQGGFFKYDIGKSKFIFTYSD